MKRWRWIISFLIAIMAVLTVDYFFMHRLFPSKKAALLHRLKQNVEEEIAKSPLKNPAEEPTPPRPPELPSGE